MVERRDRWAPQVVRRDGRLVLRLHVASGHMDRNADLVVEHEHAEVLARDERRYYLLYCALHHPYQLATTELDPPTLRQWLDTVLLAPEVEASAFLTDLDHGWAHGAVSNLMSITTGVDRLRLRDGEWFSAD